MQSEYHRALAILDKSTVLYNETELSSIIENLASAISQEFVHDIPLFLTVMNGGVFFCTSLLTHIKSPFMLDYIHATRYNNTTSGQREITWYYKPKVETIKGKRVYIVDDILDEGHTLDEIRKFVLSAGAKECKIVVLIDKNIGKEKPLAADFVGLSAPDKYLFGYGLDIFGLYRQLPNIYSYNLPA